MTDQQPEAPAALREISDRIERELGWAKAGVSGAHYLMDRENVDGMHAGLVRYITERWPQAPEPAPVPVPVDSGRDLPTPHGQPERVSGDVLYAAAEMALEDAALKHTCGYGFNVTLRRRVVDLVMLAIGEHARIVPKTPATAITEPAEGISAQAHRPGPKRMVGREAVQHCYGCGARWPCEGSWQLRAEAAEALITEARAAILADWPRLVRHLR
jgi:hypothetical protein